MKKYLATTSSTAEFEIKKSRFIARAMPVETEEAAQQFIQEAAIRSATHNCFAWRLDEVSRAFDDGEPGGTAGRPILFAIEHQQLYRVAVIVTRWFGGIKLGTGGLARAYGSAAAAALQTIEKVEWIPRTHLEFETPFESLGAIYNLLGLHSATRLNETYTSKGLVLKIELPSHLSEAFTKAVTDATRGSAVFL